MSPYAGSMSAPAALALVPFFLPACLAAASSPSPALPAAPTTPNESMSCPSPYDSAAPQVGWNKGFLVAGQPRSFFLIVPVQNDGPAPLFMAFNGTTEDGEQFATRARLQQFADKGFVVVAPSSAGNGDFWPVWDGLRARGHEADPNADIALFDQLLACVSAHIRVDPARVYVGGHSAGGIFTNALLQRRSEVIAGAIVASGVYSQTSPDPVVPLHPTTVIVTWGGDNDRWSGRAGGTAVRDFSFVAEAAAAGQAYADAGAGVVSCEGEGVGHAWLDGLNPWMADLLLAHPKGGLPLGSLPVQPSGVRASCVLGPVLDTPPDAMVCPASSTPGCQYMCQQLTDGAVRNKTVQPVLQGELAKLGFDAAGCVGCVEHCETHAVSLADTDVLSCITLQPPVDSDQRGIAAALPLIDGVDTCCAGRDDSGWCLDICGTMRRNLAARPYFKGCPK